jgi:tetratricopeptide (TPR) repeat protein/tRNA A-37 threonylcarbamoyl transferase component Bud32/TolB-like protein
MSPERWSRIKELVADTLEQPPTERDTFVDRLSAGDEDLSAEVRRLVANYEEAGEFLSVPPFSFSARPASEARLLPGEVLAERFRIVQLLGAGGMGEVYEVEDLFMAGERAALKTLRLEIAQDEASLARFRRELRLARRVTHPNVCRVFDLGKHTDAHREITFLTMEVLAGETLAQHLARRGKLPFHEALALTHQLAAGLDALHEAGIVHRDFKPGNVILAGESDGGRRAVITDFGLARVVPSTAAATGTGSTKGDAWGTPDYMAPEQLAGEPVSHATDVYALGLVLYEMLSGERPFADSGPLQSAVKRATVDPPPLRVKLPELDERTERVVMRCLERRPEDRPQRPNIVVRDLAAEEFIATPAQPKQGGPAAPRQRRWQPATVAFAFVVLLVALFAVSLRFLQQEPIAETASSGEHYVAVLPLKAGEDPELRAIADTLMQTVSSRLGQFEGVGRRLVVVPASEVLRQDVRSAQQAADKLGAGHAIEGNLQAEGERLRATFTLVDPRRRQLGSQVVEGSRRQILNLEDGVVLKLSNLLNFHLRSDPLRRPGDVAPAKPGPDEFYLQGMVYLQRNDDVKNVDTAMDLFQRALDSDQKHAASWAGLAEACWYRYGDKHEEPWLEKARQAAEQALALNDQLAHSHIAAGLLRNGAGDSEAAVADFERALALEPRNGRAFDGLGEAREKLGQYRDAEAAYLKAVSLRPGDWLAYKRLGLFYYNRGEYAKAAEQYRRVVELTPDNAHGYANLGAFLLYAGEYTDAEAALRKAVSIRPTVGAISNLGKIYFDQGKFSQAVVEYERAVEMQQNHYRPRLNLAGAYWNAQRREQAREAYREALRLLELEITVAGEQAALLADLAHCQAGLGQGAAARATLERALRHNPDDPQILAGATETYAMLRDWDRVREYFGRARRAGYAVEQLLKSPNLQPWTARGEMQSAAPVAPGGRQGP